MIIILMQISNSIQLLPPFFEVLLTFYFLPLYEVLLNLLNPILAKNTINFWFLANFCFLLYLCNASGLNILSPHVFLFI